MYTNKVEIRVRYAETDQMGYVYYGNYATYFEVARVETIRSLGFSYKELEQMGIMMPVLEYKSKFIRPAKYDDLLTIVVIVKTMPSVRFLFEYEVYNQQNELLNISETTLVFVNAISMKPIAIPDDISKALKGYF